MINYCTYIKIRTHIHNCLKRKNKQTNRQTTKAGQLNYFFAPARKPYLLFTRRKNGDLGATSVTERSCAAPRRAAPISKVVRNISDRCSYYIGLLFLSARKAIRYNVNIALNSTFSVLIKYSETSIKRTPSIKRTLSRVPKLTSYISLYNKPLFSGHLY